MECPLNGPGLSVIRRHLREPLFEFAISTGAAHAVFHGSEEYRERIGDSRVAAQELAFTGRRGPKLDVETLEQVVEILQRNKRNPRWEIVERLHVSERTASRYIAKVKWQGRMKRNGED